MRRHLSDDDCAKGHSKMQGNALYVPIGIESSGRPYLI